MRLKRDFFNRPVIDVSKDILGKYIVVGNKSGKVIETESYLGTIDRASHSFGGKITKRNHIEYGPAAKVYIYLVYGMYWQLNITTGEKNVPECFLIRAIDSDNDLKLTNGPGKLCNYLKLDKTFYGEDVVTGKKIYFKDLNEEKPKIIQTKRIGIDYAGPYWAKRKLRFLIKDYQKYLR